MTAYKKSMRQALQEMYLVEDNMSMMRKAAGGAAQTLKMKDGKLGMDSFTASAIMKVYDAVNDKNKKMIDGMLNGKRADIMKLQKFAMSKVNASYNMNMEEFEEEFNLFEHKGDSPHKHPHDKEETGDPDDQYDDEEERQVSEGRMKDLHGYIQDGKTAEQIAKLMKLDVKTIKSLMAGYNESAASDARRAIAKDKDFKVGKVDDADKDTHFDPRKDKAASANIIMQLRKAGNRASMGVEFGDGKKHKVPPQIAQKVQSKYNSYSRPAEKQAFQSKIAKSYKDMLKALKEDYSPIKETILDRIAHKLMERKND